MYVILKLSKYIILLCRRNILQIYNKQIILPHNGMTPSRLITAAVAVSLDRHVGLNVTAHVWRCMPRQLLVSCVVSFLALMQRRPKTVLHVSSLPLLNFKRVIQPPVSRLRIKLFYVTEQRTVLMKETFAFNLCTELILGTCLFFVVVVRRYLSGRFSKSIWVNCTYKKKVK